ncbi:MAG: TspO/MBR family protein [Candidatus Sulfotelmatobacter sp.]
MSKGNARSLLALTGFGLATAGAAWYGARYSRKESRATWHCRLDKPSLTPPKKVCPVVWTALYAMMAWSGWRIWSAVPSRERTHALRLWISQLATNAKWSGLFLGEQSPTLALADAIALEGMIFSYIKAARKVDRAAAGAFIPYAAWVAYAALLNSEIGRLNQREA